MLRLLTAPLADYPGVAGSLWGLLGFNFCPWPVSLIIPLVLEKLLIFLLLGLNTATTAYSLANFIWLVLTNLMEIKNED
jgi:hypothetical protein